MNLLDADLGGLLAQTGLTSLRVFVAFSLLPLFVSRLVPGLARGCLVVAISVPPVLARLHAPPVLPDSALGLLLLVVREGAIGVLLGLGIGAFCAGLQAAGEVIDHQTGLTFTQNIDPMHGNSTSLSAHLLERVLFAALMASGLLLLVVDALYLSYQVWPVGQAPSGFAQQVPMGLVTQASRLFSWALLLAGPVVLVLFVVDTSLALLNRSAPNLHVSELSTSIKPLVGLGVLAAALPMILERTVLALFEAVVGLKALILGIGG